MVEYLGVPFAASTGGVNRFAPPKPAPSWAGELAATARAGEHDLRVPRDLAQPSTPSNSPRCAHPDRVRNDGSSNGYTVRRSSRQRRSCPTGVAH
ncbi:hypothetical protein [Nocardia gipuzkoensis]|uniref:hypothetical protein n=1 Tax=Nocardia gipuzkoensis TaxID=2749991 RepID=UPI0038CDBF6A